MIHVVRTGSNGFRLAQETVDNVSNYRTGRLSLIVLRVLVREPGRGGVDPCTAPAAIEMKKYSRKELNAKCNTYPFVVSSM